MSEIEKTKKEYFSEMYKTAKGQMIVELNIKDKQDEVKERYARIHQLKDKKGQLQPSQVKMDILKQVLKKREDESKLTSIEQKRDIFEEYYDNYKKENERKGTEKEGQFFPINEMNSLKTTEESKSELPTIDNVKDKLSQYEDIEYEEIMGMEIIVKTLIERDKERELEKREKEKRENEGRKPKTKKTKQGKVKDPEKEEKINKAIDDLLELLGIDRQSLIS